MKITFVMPGPAGGGARMVARFATGLIEKGHDVCILYPHPERNLKSVLRSAWINIRYQKRGDWLHSFPGVVQPYNCLTPELVSHNDFLIGVGVDCVLAITELPRECGIKINNSHGRELWIKERMLRAWHFPMPRIVVTSHLEHEMQGYGCKDEIFVVHYGIDRTDYYPSNPDGKLTGVGTVYHGGSVKDPETIFKVFRIIHERRPEIPLIIFGGFPRPQGLPDAAQYTRLPAMPMVRELYSQAKVWFCASRSEGFGLPLIEAMACGCAVVSTDCGGPSDFMRSGESGFLVPVGDAEEIANRIFKLFDDSALCQRFVAASQPVLESFTWPKAINGFESALISIQRAALQKPKREQ